MLTELWSPDEDRLYRSLFDSGQTMVSANNAKTKSNVDVAAILERAGLDSTTKRCLWDIGNRRQLRNLEFDDFACICRLVAHCQEIGRNSKIVAAGESALKDELRSRLFMRPQQLPKFQ